MIKTVSKDLHFIGFFIYIINDLLLTFYNLFSVDDVGFLPIVTCIGSLFLLQIFIYCG